MYYNQRLKQDELMHYGVLGMKWGVRKDRRKTEATFSKSSDKKIVTNRDGSKTIPKGFVFNRVGKERLDVNKSGGLYVSYGKDDAARYIKSLGPTLVGNLLGTSHNTVQHISVKSPLKVPSDKDIAMETANLLRSDKNLSKSIKNSIFAYAFNVGDKEFENGIKNPLSSDGKKVLYCLSSILGDPNYSKEASSVYSFFRSKGYDAIPDIHDRLSGTSSTAMIVINPQKVDISSTTYISKDVLKSAKRYMKTLEKLPVSELLK